MDAPHNVSVIIGFAGGKAKDEQQEETALLWGEALYRVCSRVHPLRLNGSRFSLWVSPSHNLEEGYESSTLPTGQRGSSEPCTLTVRETKSVDFGRKSTHLRHHTWSVDFRKNHC